MTIVSPTRLTVRAEVHDDARTQEISFNAAAYFDQMTDRTLLRLIAKPPSYDYDTDAIAEFFDDKLPEIGAFFQTKPDQQPISGDTNGFEVTYEYDDVVQFARATRPWLADAIRLAEEGELDAEQDFAVYDDIQRTPGYVTRQVFSIGGRSNTPVEQERIVAALNALGLSDISVTRYDVPVYPD